MKTFNIANLAKTYGADKLRFFFPASPLYDCGFISFTTSDDEQIVVEAKAIEKFNRMVSEGYKMILQPLDDTYAGQDFYICDFERLCKAYPEEYYVMIGEEVIKG